MSHYSFERIASLSERSSEMTLGTLLARALVDLNANEAVVEFSREIIYKLVCPQCKEAETVFLPVGAVNYQQGRCPVCGTPRIVETLSGFHGQAELAERTLDQLGLPLYDIYLVRVTDEGREDEMAYLMAGDAEAVLGRNAVSKAEEV
jgi:transposase-like protein